MRIFKDVFYLFANPSFCSCCGREGKKMEGRQMKSKSSLQTLSHRDYLRDLGVVACHSKGIEEGRLQRR
jgi:hypothetical protein